MGLRERARDFYHSSVVNKALLLIAVVGGAIGLNKYNQGTHHKDYPLYVKGKHTEMRTDPESGKKYQAYIIESKHGEFECDGSKTPFNAASRADAKARYDAFELYHDYEITVAKKGLFGDKRIVDMRNVRQKIHLEPWKDR